MKKQTRLKRKKQHKHDKKVEEFLQAICDNFDTCNIKVGKYAPKKMIDVQYYINEDRFWFNQYIPTKISEEYQIMLIKKNKSIGNNLKLTPKAQKLHNMMYVL